MTSPLPKASDGRTAVQVARQCARDAAAIIRTAYRLERHDLGTKGRGDIVTAADLAVEARIHEILNGAYPAFPILSEETRSTTATDGWVWVIDPIDGTTNFLHGIPYFCVNIGLCFDGEPVLGLTYDPLQREEFLAVSGGGVRVNGKPVHASEKSLADATVVFDFGLTPRTLQPMAAFQSLAREVLYSRVLGSTALSLAYIAAGRADLFVFGGGRPWDFAAGIILVNEAGGVITNVKGERMTLHGPGVLAGSPAAHADFLERARGEPWFELP